MDSNQGEKIPISGDNMSPNPRAINPTYDQLPTVSVPPLSMLVFGGCGTWDVTQKTYNAGCEEMFPPGEVSG